MIVVHGQLGKFDSIKEPHVECYDGSKEWYVDGKYHRLDGPAVIYTDGRKEWYVDGKLHRLDGPAVIYTDGKKEWWIDNNQLDTEEVGTWLEENNIDLKTEEGQLTFRLKWI